MQDLILVRDLRLGQVPERLKDSGPSPEVSQGKFANNERMGEYLPFPEQICPAPSSSINHSII